MRGRIQAVAQIPEIQDVLDSVDPHAGPLLTMIQWIRLFLATATERGDAGQVSL